jgi:hypothetical protein
LARPLPERVPPRFTTTDPVVTTAEEVLSSSSVPPLTVIGDV